MKRGPNKPKQKSQAKRVRFTDEVAIAETTLVATDKVEIAAATPVATNVTTPNQYMPVITPARSIAGLGGFGWAGFCLAFGSAPFSLPLALATVTATTTITLAPFAAIKAGKATYNYFCHENNAIESQPAKTQETKSTKQLARELNALIGEEMKNKTSFKKFEAIAKSVEKGEKRAKVWHYAHKSLRKMQDNPETNKASIKQKYEAKAAKLK